MNSIDARLLKLKRKKEEGVFNDAGNNELHVQDVCYLYQMEVDEIEDMLSFLPASEIM
jgi:hypothetical protein